MRRIFALVLVPMALLASGADCRMPRLSGARPTPPPERLRFEGPADPSGTIAFVWDAPDSRWGLSGVAYRVRVERAEDQTVVFRATFSSPRATVPPETLVAGTAYRVAVEAGAGTPAIWSRERTLEFRAGADLDRDGVDDRLEFRLARTFAPEIRFNARFAGTTGNQNRDELYFPSSVESLDRWLHDEWVPRADPDTGLIEIVPNFEGARPGVHFRAFRRAVPLGNLAGDDDRAARFAGGPEIWWPEEVEATDLLRARAPDGRGILEFGEDEVYLDGWSLYLPGDPPGKAPAYTHVYPISSATRPDGSRRETYGIEYWLFYPQDYAGVLNLDRFGLELRAISVGSHRGDWEHSAFEVERIVDLSGRETRLAHVRAVYYGHDRSIAVPAAKLGLVDDAGRPGAPGATHPRVFIAWGKHASFPAAGVWVNSAPGYDDQFHGSGAVMRTWRSGLVDLGEKDAPRPACEWTRYRGNWGPDILLFGLGSSPRGPAIAGSWGKLSAGLRYDEWVATAGVKLD
ncbi:MAG: hypothetical protein HY720_24605 [Planctomycetes bacterium]|nr:hypothetical protein [Planctomycetota bacterium]